MSQTDAAAATAAPDGKPLRSDARRNRDQLLAAAAEVFADRGADASLEEVARRAGVGIGTLYRNFPNREALTEAVYRRELETLCDAAPGLLAEYPADQALARWMNQFVEYVAIKRGMATALKAALGADNELFAYSHRRIREALGSLVAAAIAAGAIRADADPEDLLRALSGLCMAVDAPGAAGRTGRIVDLLVDGLRFGAPAGR